MTVQELAAITAGMPYDAQVRFVCNMDGNPHNDYYDVLHAYLLQFQGGDDDEGALYLTGGSSI